MADRQTAPEDGVIRNDQGNARRVRKGSVVPAGWTFEATAQKSRERKPAQTTQASGPSETAKKSTRRQDPSGTTFTTEVE